MILCWPRSRSTARSRQAPYFQQVLEDSPLVTGLAIETMRAVMTPNLWHDWQTKSPAWSEADLADGHW